MIRKLLQRLLKLRKRFISAIAVSFALGNIQTFLKEE